MIKTKNIRAKVIRAILVIISKLLTCVTFPLLIILILISACVKRRPSLTPKTQLPPGWDLDVQLDYLCRENNYTYNQRGKLCKGSVRLTDVEPGLWYIQALIIIYTIIYHPHPGPHYRWRIMVLLNISVFVLWRESTKMQQNKRWKWIPKIQPKCPIHSIHRFISVLYIRINR